jgi:hypothetical protein
VARPTVSWFLELTASCVDTEYLPSDINRYLWRIRDLHTRHDESHAQLADHLKAFASVTASPNARAPAMVTSSDDASSSQQLNGANGLQRVVDSVSDKEMELRLLISQCLNDTSYSVNESAIEARRLEEYVDFIAFLLETWASAEIQRFNAITLAL